MVFMGYYKLDQTTLETITTDGWLKTGDIGQLLPGSNALKIIDRKKNIFKLQQGEYVASEKVEAVYLKSKLITEAFLHGDSSQNYAVVVVVPSVKEIKALAVSNGIPYDVESVL